MISTTISHLLRSDLYQRFAIVFGDHLPSFSPPVLFLDHQPVVRRQRDRPLQLVVSDHGVDPDEVPSLLKQVVSVPEDDSHHSRVSHVVNYAPLVRALAADILQNLRCSGVEPSVDPHSHSLEVRVALSYALAVHVDVAQEAVGSGWGEERSDELEYCSSSEYRGSGATDRAIASIKRSRLELLAKPEKERN